jgi:VanZ family protein
MLDLRFARYWRMASLLGMLLVLAAALIPSNWLWPDTASLRWFLNDKWLHGLTFAFLAVWFCGQYTRASYWRVALGLLAFGVLIEICQQALAYRSADFKDLTANLAGITTGLLIALVGAGGWSLHFENWVYRQRD